jgi:predicted ATPase/DNA-binding SARP family transcriptional activator
MEVRVLGPLEVVHDGCPVALGSPKERSLFALLTVHANEVVSLDRLVDELWDGNPPDQAASAVRVYISHLRKTLPADRLLTKGTGYVLQLDDGELDAARFAATVTTSRAKLAAGDAATAATSLTAALALVRGEPFVDVAATPSVTAEAARLTEAHVAALEDRIDADLQCGRHREVVGELTTLVGEHPLRERLWGQLIVALYRCGRQADALRAYQQARAKLVEELGIEPGPELRQLEKLILDQDDTLAAPRTVNVRHNLPAARTSFVGRERELAQVHDLLERSRLVTLTGIGGVGKTRLAIEAAKAELSAFPDGVFLVELATVKQPDVIAYKTAVTMGLEIGPTEVDMAERLLQALARAKALLVYDNCEHLIDGVAELVDQVLQRTEHVVVLATSRESLGVGGEQSWRVPSLSLPGDDDRVEGSDAVQLFRDCARRVDASFEVTSANRSAVAQVCRQLDGIPLALELAAARLRMLTPQQVADRLDDRFRLLTGGGRTSLPRHQTLQAAMDWSYDLLDEDGRVLLRRLAVFVGGFTLEAAETVCGGGLDEVARLVDKSLVIVEDGRYRLLETVRQYALDRLIAAGEVDDMRRRHCEWFVPVADRCANFALNDEQRALARAERENFIAAFEWAQQQGDGVASIRLGLPLTNFSFLNIWSLEGSPFAMIARIDEIVATLTEPRDLIALARFHTGIAALFQGDAALARTRAHEALEHAVGITRGESIQLLGWIDHVEGNSERAYREFEESYELLSTRGDSGAAWAALGMSLTHLANDELDAAERKLEDAVGIGRRVADSSVLPTVLAQCARVAALRGEMDRSRALIEESIDAGEVAGVSVSIISSLLALAHAAYAADDRQGCVAFTARYLERVAGQAIGVALGEALAIMGVLGEGEPHELTRLLASAVTLSGLSTWPATPWLRTAVDEVLANVRHVLGDDEFEHEWAAGDVLSPSEAVALALHVGAAAL